MTFGTHTFAPGSLRPREIITGVGADLWFDTNLESATPTKVWAWFADDSGNLFLGGVKFGASSIAFVNTSSIDARSPEGVGTVTVSADVPTTVPEPTSLLLLGTGLLAVASRVRQTSRQR